jgi:hypothetical protein
MANITIVSRIRLIAGIAPAVLLIVCPFASLAFSAFGNIPATIKENQLAAINYANGLDAALYKMEWGRTQPESAQIIVDQQRRFADMLDSAAHNIYTAEQREKLQTIADAAKPILDTFRHADPRDEVENAKMRDLHMMVTSLLNADEAALDQYSDLTIARAREFIVLILIAGVLLPIGCYAFVWRFTETVRADLRTMRKQLEKIEDQPGAKDLAGAPEIVTIDQALTRLGFPKPNPMLAEG